MLFLFIFDENGENVLRKPIFVLVQIAERPCLVGVRRDLRQNKCGKGYRCCDTQRIIALKGQVLAVKLTWRSNYILAIYHCSAACCSHIHWT